MFQIFLDLFLARLSEQTEPKEKEVSTAEDSQLSVTRCFDVIATNFS